MEIHDHYIESGKNSEFDQACWVRTVFAGESRTMTASWPRRGAWPIVNWTYVHSCKMLEIPRRVKSPEAQVRDAENSASVESPYYQLQAVRVYDSVLKRCGLCSRTVNLSGGFCASCKPVARQGDMDEKLPLVSIKSHYWVRAGNRSDSTQID